ncbi:Transmembrane and coiled-coil domain-containing protein 4 [Oryzias melastigma]|uniref:Transmembrane and coiled-coil domain-containing protein 4 n=1 Tax=Oryzias melastigma TaxID=30732 RepID=A0A834CIG6_ORYME|nr:Transmembrane and coiled-coil domain-containing protein 4 [Oryzias melastigma]
MEEKLNNMDSDFLPDPGGPEPEPDAPHEKVISRQLPEASRFALSALCGVSLGQLFAGCENRSFPEQFLKDLVTWLDLDESVMPVMGAFLSGLGVEGSDTFLSILQADPLLAAGATPIVQDLVSFSIKDGQYDARARVLIRHVSCLLRTPPRRLEEFEETLGERLREAGRGERVREESTRRLRRERGRKLRRYLLIGLATVGGGTVIGVTGGLAAPLVAAGAGAVLGAGGAAALGSAAGIAIMASLFGAAGAGLTGYKMKKCVGAIEEFEFLPMNSGKHLHVSIAVTGWLCSGKYSSFQAPWSSLGECGEQYCLVWESRFLRDLGSAMTSLLDGLVSMVAQEALKYTVLSGIVTALTWPASLLAAASVIDNPWCVCLNRSAEVGKHLAQVLRSRQQGRRPVSLIGFSLGARVIYYCLQELAGDQGSEGVVEDVVLLGAPVDGSEKAWERMTRVVAGKIVNGYCRGDWLLGFLYRSSAAQLSVAGLQPGQHPGSAHHQRGSVLCGLFSLLRSKVTWTTCGRWTPSWWQWEFPPKKSQELPSLCPSRWQNGTSKKKMGTRLGILQRGRSLTLREEERGQRGREQETGWDIPDISDLLDSVYETEEENSSTFQGGVTDGDTGIDARPGRTEESDLDEEHFSWSWKDTDWTSGTSQE